MNSARNIGEVLSTMRYANEDRTWVPHRAAGESVQIVAADGGEQPCRPTS